MVGADRRQERDGGARLLAEAEQAARLARHRATVIGEELFLEEALRSTDYQRATVLRLAETLAQAIEDELRLELAVRLDPRSAIRPSLEAARLPLAQPRLGEALRDPELLGLLLRRAEEHRLILSARDALRHEPLAERFVDLLLASPDPDVARAAMALLIAESRRFDRFHDAAVARTDLPAEVQHRLVWRVAAALRTYLVVDRAMAAAAADRLVASAAGALLARYDEEETLDARAAALARALDRVGMLDDDALLRLAREGHPGVTVAALAQRVGVEVATAWEMALASDGSRLAVLLAAADLDPPVAAAMLLMFAGPTAADDWIGELATLGLARARDALQLWRLDPGYRRAVGEMMDLKR